MKLLQCLTYISSNQDLKVTRSTVHPDVQRLLGATTGWPHQFQRSGRQQLSAPLRTTRRQQVGRYLALDHWIALLWNSLENESWLVVWTPLKNISQFEFGWLFPIYGKIKNVPNHQPVLFVVCSFFFNWCSFFTVSWFGIQSFQKSASWEYEAQLINSVVQKCGTPEISDGLSLFSD